MKILFTFILFLVTHLSNSQCFEKLNARLDSIDDIPYVMEEKFVFDVKSGKLLFIKVKNVFYKTKLGFIFQSHNLGDTLDVTLMTLNKKILTRKKITNNDYFLRYEPFRKSENYFLSVQTKTQLDSNKRVIEGCLGVVIVERVSKKAFKSVQNIKWEVQKN